MLHPIAHTSHYLFRCPRSRSWSLSSVWKSFSKPLSCQHTDSTKRPPQPLVKTYYDLFPQTLPAGPPPLGAFCIDTRALRREFLQLQSVAHPDRRSPEFKSDAQVESAEINEAYKTLINPLLRAQYLLHLHSIDVKSEELQLADQELLCEVMELQETIEEAIDQEYLEKLKAMNQNRIRQSEQILEKHFRLNDLNAAKLEAIRLRYWIRLQDSLDSKISL